jgi:hypothetical protein
MKTYNIRIRAEYTGYYKVKAASLNDAEIKARQKLFDEMNDEVDGSFDFEEFEDEEHDAHKQTMTDEELKSFATLIQESEDNQ